MKTSQPIHTVELSFFEDDATGEFGLAHTKTHNENSPFNAFWNGIGIFHDVFEHWFELEHEYFLGDNGMNVGGEMAAMGAAYYYYDVLNVHNRYENGYRTFADVMRQTTESEVMEAIQCGYTNFGNTLNCGVPRQRPLDNGELEYQIEMLYNNVKNLSYDRQSYVSKIEENASKNYKKSVTLGKIANLHRWGYRMAENLIPDNRHNQIMCGEFIDFFNNFCKSNSAEDLTSLADTLTIQLFKDGEEITWSAFITTKENQKIEVTTASYIVDELYSFEDEENDEDYVN